MFTCAAFAGLPARLVRVRVKARVRVKVSVKN